MIIFFPIYRGFLTGQENTSEKLYGLVISSVTSLRRFFHFQKAIENMSQKSQETESWHVVGTISELIELLILEERLPEAVAYYNEAINILFGAGFDSPEKIKKKSKLLSFKTKNKLVSIKLELARLYHKLDDLTNEKKSLDDAILLIFNEAFTAYAGKEILENYRQEIKIPQWLSAEEVYSTLGWVADFYQSHDNPWYSIPLYQAAIHFCKVPIKRAILLCNLGSTCYMIGEISHAVKFFTEGLAILSEDQSSQDESLNAKATILFNLAMTYEANAEIEKSQKVFEQLWSMKKQFSQLSAEKQSLVQSRLIS
ncbi:hypothetical protein DSO57_1019962 [Entomophthora muscae]|uniref:Uncharacterized protein n=1 Tax=Entomophthora muscae TaxID=34485 RepID=A0ACC2SH37_9FUNG|nr:hypothetical protein DSO57_1019962 [Entomophthora muscae]